MIRSPFRPYFVTLALLAAFGGPRAHAVTLLYSNDVQGDIEPCGCRENPYGGMVRKAGLIARLGHEPLVQLDGGDLLFNAEIIPEALIPQAEVQARYLLDAMKTLGHDAAVPGPKDMALGIKVFEKLIQPSGIKFLAANLKKKSGAKFLPESAVFLRKDEKGKPLRIGVLGLVGAQYRWPKELKVSSPIEVAKKLVPALRKQVDLVIALTHEGLEADQALAAQVNGIDIIVGGGTQSFLQEVTEVKNPNGEQTRIFQSSFRNQYIGQVKLERPFSGKDHKLVGLDAGFEKSEPMNAKQEKVRAIAEKFKLAIAQINSKALEESHARLNRLNTPGREGAHFQTLPRCAECHWKQFDFWRTTRHADALTPLLMKKQLRNKECLSCHTVGFTPGTQSGSYGWRELNELATVRGEGSETQTSLTPEEIQAFLAQVHTAKSLDTPVILARIPANLPLRESLGRLEKSYAPVQCENCHGVGGDHPMGGQIIKATARETCLKCHTAELAPKWYKSGNQPDWDLITKKRALIACPAGELN